MPIIVSEENKKTKVLDSSVNIEVIDGDPMPDQDPDNKKIPTGDATATPQDIMAGKTAYAKAIKLTGTYHPLDTSDATATPQDIRSGKTAYVNGVKVEGNLGDLTNAGTGSPWNGRDYIVYNPETNNLFVQLYEIRKGYSTIFNNTSYQVTNIPVVQFINNIGLTSDKIVSGNTILGIEGNSENVNTSDATAEAMRIEEGYTAYVNGEKITGTLKPVGSYGFGSASYPAEKVQGQDAIRVKTGLNTNGLLLRDDLDGNIWVSIVQSYSGIANAINLTPNQIAKGSTVLGVEGTIQGPVLQDKEVIPSVTQKVIIPDEEYNGLSSVTISGVDSTIDQNIKEQNIKKGVNILGVEGTYIGEAVNAIYSLEYNSLDGNLYSVASDGTTRTPYELENDELIINIGDDDVLIYSIVDKCLEVVIDG